MFARALRQVGSLLIKDMPPESPKRASSGLFDYDADAPGSDGEAIPFDTPPPQSEPAPSEPAPTPFAAPTSAAVSAEIRSAEMIEALETIREDHNEDGFDATEFIDLVGKLSERDPSKPFDDCVSDALALAEIQGTTATALLLQIEALRDDLRVRGGDALATLDAQFHAPATTARGALEAHNERIAALVAERDRLAAEIADARAEITRFEDDAAAADAAYRQNVVAAERELSELLKDLDQLAELL